MTWGIRLLSLDKIHLSSSSSFSGRAHWSIWQALPRRAGEKQGYLMLQDWPQAREELSFPAEERDMELVMEVRFIITNRLAFQILLAKLRMASQRSV